MRDNEIFKLISTEEKRQNDNIQLIASENFVSADVREAQGSILTNKYAEGYPGRRYYGGCEIVDQIENIAIERLKKVFNTPYHANVQPHSGSQANQAVFMAVLNPGDTILGMDLSHGGHLTHGHKMNLSGKLFNIESYGITEDTQLIDYDNVRQIALNCQPKLIISGASAYSRKIDFQKFREIADEVGAYLLADIAHIAGLIVADLHPTPFGYAHFVTSTTHKTLRGPRGGIVLCEEKYAKIIDSSVFPGIQGGPLEHVIAAKAIAFKEALAPEFNDYQIQVIKNMKALCEEFKKLNYHIISDGSDNHLMLIDVYKSRGLTGKEVQILLDENNITVNKNTVPNDPKSPMVTSGIRIGTPAMTTRGFKEKDFINLAQTIDKIIEKHLKERK